MSEMLPTLKRTKSLISSAILISVCFITDIRVEDFFKKVPPKRDYFFLETLIAAPQKLAIKKIKRTKKPSPI